VRLSSQLTLSSKHAEAIYGHLTRPTEWQQMRQASDAATAHEAADVTHDRRCRSASDAVAPARLVLTRQRSVREGLALDAIAASDATELSVRRSENNEETFHDFAPFLSFGTMKNKCFISTKIERTPNPSLPLKLHRLRKCANTTKSTSPCACLLVFSQSFFKTLR
jgi:hypothetical protein